MYHRIAFVFLAVALGVSANASAQRYQGFTLDRFQLAPTPEDGLALQLPSTLGPGRLSTRLAFAYQNEPLVSGAPGADDVAIVAHHLALHSGFTVGVGERAELFATIPLVPYQAGDQRRGSGLSFPVPRELGIGDPAVGASAHVFGRRERGFQLGLNGALILPIGSQQALASDGGLGARGTVSAALVLPEVTLALEGGAAYRPARQFGFFDLGSELLMRAGAYAPLAKGFRVFGEASGATRLGDGKTFEELDTPFEALFGGDYATRGGLRIGIAGGAGLTLGTGTPAVRVLAMFGFAAPQHEQAAGWPARSHPHEAPIWRRTAASEPSPSR